MRLLNSFTYASGIYFIFFYLKTVYYEIFTSTKKSLVVASNLNISELSVMVRCGIDVPGTLHNSQVFSILSVGCDTDVWINSECVERENNSASMVCALWTALYCTLMCITLWCSRAAFERDLSNHTLCAWICDGGENQPVKEYIKSHGNMDWKSNQQEISKENIDGTLTFLWCTVNKCLFVCCCESGCECRYFLGPWWLLCGSAWLG